MTNAPSVVNFKTLILMNAPARCIMLMLAMAPSCEYYRLVLFTWAPPSKLKLF